VRTPTPHEQVWDWHRRALQGERMPIHDSTPQAGYYLARLVARGAYVPGSIWLEQPVDPDTGELVGDERYRAEILGEEVEPNEAWLWLSKRPICRLEYLRRLGEIF
jgi:hypothetical protein